MSNGFKIDVFALTVIWFPETELTFISSNNIICVFLFKMSTLSPADKLDEILDLVINVFPEKETT